MKNGFDSQRYAGSRRITQVWDYSGRRSIKRSTEEETCDFLYPSRQSVKRRREYEEEVNYRRSSNRRREECSRRYISMDIVYGRSSNRGRREESSLSRRHDDINFVRSSNKKSRREEESNYGRSSHKRKRGYDDNISLNFHSNARRREDSNNRRRESCSFRSVVKEDTTNVISNSKCVDVSLLESYKEDDDDEMNATPVGSFPCFVDDAIVIEILSRLPVKPLLRFKSVCKHWLSLITQDQHFIHLHSTRSEAHPKLLCIAPKPQDKETETLAQRILSANLSTGGEGKVSIHNVKNTTFNTWFDYDMVFGPINGLVCFVQWKKAAAKIYNVSTREVTPWFNSTLFAEEKDKFESEDNPVKIERHFLQIYQMGFDPEKIEHKVFCFWRLYPVADPSNRCYSDPSYASWEALTVGRDTKWRRISVVPDENNLIKIQEVLPPYRTIRNPVNANGTIYWTNKLMSSEEGLDGLITDLAPSDPDVIIAFDVGSEKYRVIPIPSFILDEPREKMLNRPIAMLILGGRVTLIYHMSSGIVKLWMLDDGFEKKLENCQGKGTSNWSEETITLPRDFNPRSLCFHGVPTSADKILISLPICTDDCTHDRMACLYSYDRKTKTSEEIGMEGIFSIPPLHHSRSLFTTYTESLIPVLPQQDRSRCEYNISTKIKKRRREPRMQDGAAAGTVGIALRRTMETMDKLGTAIVGQEGSSDACRNHNKLIRYFPTN